PTPAGCRKKRPASASRCSSYATSPSARKESRQARVGWSARTTNESSRQRASCFRRRSSTRGCHEPAIPTATGMRPGPSSTRYAGSGLRRGAGPTSCPRWGIPSEPTATDVLRVSVAVWRGTFGAAQAERLLWRAGFGPRPGEAQKLARLGLEGAVHKLTHPGREHLVGHKPHDEKGLPLAPADAWGHDHLWWLDRMVRTSRPLVERMTLTWHDWFATSNDGVDSQRLMLRQNGLFRRNSLGSFRELLLEVTHDPAMLLWLNGVENEKGAPNENYAREMMELFTLGADRGYTESDVREQARALTGWARDWKYGRPYFHYDRNRHDAASKRVFGKTGRYDWRDACLLALNNTDHASYFVTKLWSYFIPTKPNGATQR